MRNLSEIQMSGKKLLLLYLVSCALSLQSCSIFSSSSRASVLELDQFAPSELSKIEFERMPGDPPYFKVPAVNGEPLYAMLLENCQKRSKPLPPEAAVRQLFVGAEMLHLNSQQRITTPTQSVLVTDLSAVVEQAPLQFASFSTTRGACVYDLVFWSRQPVFSRDPLQGEAEKLAALLSRAAAQAQQ